MKISIKYSLSEVSNLFQKDADIIKKWTSIFADYLSDRTNPEKSQMRIYNIKDLRILAYVYLQWEDNPDIECIKIGLNEQSNLSCEPIENFIIGLTPLFQEIPENIDESFQGVVFGGEFKLDDLFNTASSYKYAGDKLMEFALQNRQEKELFQPAIYNYRHSIELYIKSIIGVRKEHNLKHLKSALDNYMIENYKKILPTWFDNLIESFHYTDPDSASFRYGITIPNEELYADYNQILELLNWTEQLFSGIKKLQINNQLYK